MEKVLLGCIGKEEGSAIGSDPFDLQRS